MANSTTAMLPGWPCSINCVGRRLCIIHYGVVKAACVCGAGMAEGCWVPQMCTHPLHQPAGQVQGAEVVGLALHRVRGEQGQMADVGAERAEMWSPSACPSRAQDHAQISMHAWRCCRNPPDVPASSLPTG